MESKAKNLEEWLNQLTYTKFANNKSAQADIRNILYALVKTQCSCHSKFFIKVNTRLRCHSCKVKKLTKRLPECLHDICDQCAMNEMERVTSGMWDKKRIIRSQCPKCKEDFTQKGISKFITVDKLEELNKKAKANYKGVLKQCPICLDDFDVEEQGISLDCDDMFCTTCITAYVENRINENKVTDEELACPKCNKGVISDIILESLAKKAGCFDKLVKFRLRSTVNPDDFYKYCPDCEYGAFIERAAKDFYCPLCKKMMCPNCNVSPIHEGDCKVELMPVWLTSMGIRICPKCKAPIEKKSGCNFMTCASPVCHSKSYFCYLCGHKLELTEHYSHFRKKGPWGEFCNNTETEYLAKHK